ncbi:MAG: RdgB/HAM1 family non-canonical purine NTP pyrophosphatase [Parachlamydiales bacterium]|jgi:XTP/dITP diphosphohydrolase
MELVLATTNIHKIREYKAMFHGLPHIDLLTLHNFPHYVQPEETGKSFQENASIKAEHAAKTLQKWVIADDSGLVVPALKGDPGVHSRRYADVNASDIENTKKLLKEMTDFKDLQRAGFYECAIALSGPDGYLKVVTGICEGMIAEEERGNNGFGYDSVFSKHDYGGKTFGELQEDLKNKVSHRGKALEKILLFLQSKIK